MHKPRDGLSDDLVRTVCAEHLCKRLVDEDNLSGALDADRHQGLLDKPPEPLFGPGQGHLRFPAVNGLTDDVGGGAQGAYLDGRPLPLLDAVIEAKDPPQVLLEENGNHRQ